MSNESLDAYHAAQRASDAGNRADSLKKKLDDLRVKLPTRPPAQMRRDHEAMERLRHLTNGGYAPTLVFDDAGNWAVSFDGVSNVASKIQVLMVHLDEVKWCSDPAEAILEAEVDL